jgi:hypothetical protein
MKGMDCIVKRLLAVDREHKRKTPGTIVNSYPSQADSTAFYLSGGMEKPEPVNGPFTIKLSFGGKPPSSDSFKLRWLKQYTPTQIAEFRREWEISDCERDRVALAERDRLLGAAGEGAREPPILIEGPNPAS